MTYHITILGNFGGDKELGLMLSDQEAVNQLYEAVDVAKDGSSSPLVRICGANSKKLVCFDARAMDAIYATKQED